MGKIKNLTSPVDRSYWLKELSLKTKIEEKALTEEMEQIRNEKLVMSYEKKELRTQNSALSALSRRELIAQRMISLIMIKESFQSQLKEYFDYLPGII